MAFVDSCKAQSRFTSQAPVLIDDVTARITKEEIVVGNIKSMATFVVLMEDWIIENDLPSEWKPRTHEPTNPETVDMRIVW